MLFTKPPIDTISQLALLQSEGLNVLDEPRALRYLSNISLYRLKAYLPPYRLSAKVFRPGVTFDDVVGRYVFDKKLRMHLFDAIERIEVAFRTQLTNCYALSHGSHWFMQERHFNSFETYIAFQQIALRECTSKKDSFIKDYRSKYSSPALPPCWAVMELLSMGQLSRLYADLKSSPERQNIAQHFGLRDEVFESWIHNLCYIRNACAHHARIWNSLVSVSPKLPKKPLHQWLSTPAPNNRKFYVTLAIITYLLRQITPASGFKDRVLLLVQQQHDTAMYPEMGFPIGWNNDIFWT
jgi:abortive infection bacteriophage resistance protein